MGRGMSVRWSLAIACCALFVINDRASGAEATSFGEVLTQAEASSPRLLEVQADIASAEGRATQAKVWPAPSLDFEREDFGGDGAYHDSARAQTTLSLSEPIEIGGQRRARIAAGRAGVAAAEARQRLSRVELGSELAIAYAVAEAAQARIELLGED